MKYILYKGTKRYIKASVPTDGTKTYSKVSVPADDLVSLTQRERNHHSTAFQTHTAGTDTFNDSFFPHTIRDWNTHPE